MTIYFQGRRGNRAFLLVLSSLATQAYKNERISENGLNMSDKKTIRYVTVRHGADSLRKYRSCKKREALRASVTDIRYNVDIVGDSLIRNCSVKTLLDSTTNAKEWSRNLSGMRRLSEITVVMCEQETYPIWFPCWRKNYPVFCRHGLR